MNTWKRITFTCLSLLVVGFAPIGAAVAQVKVTAANPASAYQGTIALDVVVSGSDFNSSAKVQYFVTGTTNPGGITVKKVVYRNSNELVTAVDVADMAVLANFDIQVTLRPMHPALVSYCSGEQTGSPCSTTCTSGTARNGCP